MVLQDFQTLVDRMVRADASSVTTSDRDEAIRAAVARYSKDRPLLKVEDVAAVGGRFLGLPAGWAEGCALVELEHPIDADPPALLTTAEVAVETVPSGQRFRLLFSLSPGDQVRVRYTAPHVVDADTDTVPAADREAVAAWAGAHLLDQLAAEKSGDIDASIGAANVSRATPAQEYAARAKELRRRYLNGLGIDPNRVPPAGAVVALPPSTDNLGRPRLLHPRGLR